MIPLGSDENDTSLVQAYRRRLGLGPSLPLPPTHETLCLLTEKHLEWIPFENISMHLVDDSRQLVESEPVVLSEHKLVEKLLHGNRGGCCLELNGLFALLLRDLGFPHVRLVPCFVWAGRERGHNSKRPKFRTNPGHASILVQCLPSEDTGDESADQTVWMVDVGLGEPPGHPLAYGVDFLDKEQLTPEGMRSRIRWDPRGAWVDGKGNTRKCLLLEWYRWEDQEWEPRLQWDIADAPLKPVQSSVNDNKDQRSMVGPPLESFRYVINFLLAPNGSFCRKLIVCKLTKDEKVSLGGRRVKSTKPRFQSSGGKQPVATFRDLQSDQEIADVLKDSFGISILPNQYLSLLASDELENSQLWEHL